MSFLEAINSKKKGLRHCQTLVTTALGETILEDGETGCVTKVSATHLPAGYVVDMKPDLQMAQVIPRLYLGSQDPTADENLLHSNGITHILSLGVKPLILIEKQVENVNGDESQITLLSHKILSIKYIPLLDIPEASLSGTLMNCFQFIDKALKDGGRVFIHCNAGISRSPSVVIAYILCRSHFSKPWAIIPLIKEDNSPLSYSETFEMVKSVRPCVKPNPGFVKQLKEFDRKLHRGDFLF